MASEYAMMPLPLIPGQVAVPEDDRFWTVPHAGQNVYVALCAQSCKHQTQPTFDKAELAHIMGASRQTVERGLAQLLKAGLIWPADQPPPGPTGSRPA